MSFIMIPQASEKYKHFVTFNHTQRSIRKSIKTLKTSKGKSVYIVEKKYRCHLHVLSQKCIYSYFDNPLLL